MEGDWIFINDQFVRSEHATLHFSDLSIQRGYGVFDFFKVVGENPIFLEEHLDRFFFSAARMRLSISLSRYDLISVIQLLIVKNNIVDCGVRMTLTGGNSIDLYQISTPNLVISTTKFSAPKNDIIKKGIKLITYSHQRQLPEVKTIDYLMAIYLQPLLAENKADEFLYHQNGMVTECPRSNFFIVTKDDRIITPAHKILKGVTRMKIKQLVPQLAESVVTFRDISDAKAAFITSTTKMILPVCQIDQIVFDEKKTRVVDEITKGLQQLIDANNSYTPR
ncbi:MAG: branched-chain-amino-acid transaminase [Flavisolibacter sp.]